MFNSNPLSHAARAAAALALTLGLSLAPMEADAAGKIRIAFGDIASVEALGFLTAIERAKERGVDIDISYLKSEDIAAQAVVGGQADIGVGTPYALLQKVRAPIRIFYQMSTLRFYPVVNTEFYQDWKDLNGQEIAVHSRGSGTEAIMTLLARKNGIKYGQVSYVPGSEVRTGALLQGNVKATIVDSAGWRLLQAKAPGKFKVLPVEGIDASDEALYANTNFLDKEKESVAILTEELLNTFREINAKPEVVTEFRQKYNLAPDLPSEVVEDIGPYYKDAADVGLFPANGGGEDAAKDDFEFYTVAGQLQGEPASLKVADFWTLEPLTQALQKVGQR
ncbi:nitrate ABC transporter substrate-binding protein [Skermanella stibiiresistens SB22]|uniref:Nitrate ABC transporter substrate-binding protein n=1 Tax=Skermanella stibiiresistens SB22 TaxID=1385369 RepID=W9H834_9PROT|nr:ABC transporter substrate-binding protein [Skermanella stibiiresistens]EWY42164.1 nitrate ABC transporter substrate-binding protein [Skermanella stibiiresistens SB22]